jgi:hypothetical protein
MLIQGSWGWMKLAVLTVMLPAAIDSLDLAVRDDLQRHHDPRLDPIMQAATNLGRKDILFGLLLGVAILDPAAGPATARLAVTSLVVALPRFS